MNTRRLFCLFTLFLHFSFSIGAMDSDQYSASIFDVLTQGENIKLTIKTDLIQLMENRNSSDYHEATLTSQDGTVRRMKVKVRGKFRRRICEMPPLKLKFSKSSLKDEGLNDNNEIKLVTACSDARKADDWVVREHIAYELFRNFSNVSLRTKLATIVFQDIHVERMEFKMQCMLLEDIEELAYRMNCEEVEAFGLNPDSLNTNQVALVSMFNYMIGNTDWEISGNRNVKFLRSKKNPNGKILVVPYDFDFSGFINADYAIPNSQTGLKTVRERYLMADGISHAALKRASIALASEQERIYEICSTKALSRSSQHDIKGYIQTFFEALADFQAREMLELPPMD